MVQLSRLVDPRNHTTPGELTSPEVGHPLLITPAMSDLEGLLGQKKTLSHTLSTFLQLIEVRVVAAVLTAKWS